MYRGRGTKVGIELMGKQNLFALGLKERMRVTRAQVRRFCKWTTVFEMGINYMREIIAFLKGGSNRLSYRGNLDFTARPWVFLFLPFQGRSF